MTNRALVLKYTKYMDKYFIAYKYHKNLKLLTKQYDTGALFKKHQLIIFE